MKYQSTRIQAKQIKVIVLIFTFYVLPPAAIFLHLIPFSLRFILLGTIAPLLFFIGPSGTISKKSLGIIKHNLHESIVAIVPMTLVLTLLTIVSATASKPRYDNSELSAFFYIFYVLISCSFQEFAYRGYLFAVLDILRLGKWVRITLTAILYSFVHIIYIDIYILLFTLIAGLLWGIHYDKYRNLASVTISHVILGVLIIKLGFI